MDAKVAATGVGENAASQRRYHILLSRANAGKESGNGKPSGGKHKVSSHGLVEHEL